MISICGQTDSLQRRRDLRARIGRVRRRIDHRLGLVRSRGAELRVWRDYVVRSPLVALLAALMVGLSLAAGLRGRKAGEKDGLSFPAEEAYRFARWVFGKLWSRFHSTAAATGRDPRPAEAEGGEHGGT
jgi:hypothetical protein